MKLTNILDDKILRINQENYNALKDKLNTGKTTWILGAGVSVPAGLPKWDSLLTKMWARLSEIAPHFESEMHKEEFMTARREREEQIKDYSTFRSKMMEAYAGEDKKVFCGINTLESAEYMRNYIDDLIGEGNGVGTKKELINRVLKTLIKESLAVETGKPELAEELQKQAIGNLARLLKAQKRARVITYNYDDILEMCLEEIAKLTEREVSVVCDCDLEKGDEEGKINIHHPHGSLNIVGAALGKESRNIILTESSYYEMEQKVYNWENSVQAKALVETSCIFMGFSGEDYNFRRIIKNIDFEKEREKEAKHYIFFCLDDLFKNVYGSNLSRCREQEFMYEGIQLINRLYAQYSYWKHHGVIPIWSTYEELPEMVRQLTI